MSAEFGAAILLIVVLIGFNLAFFELGRSFDTRESIELGFAALHRLLGVGVGEHLGYLRTGGWTVLVAVSVVTTPVVSGCEPRKASWMAISRIPASEDWVKRTGLPA